MKKIIQITVFVLFAIALSGLLGFIYIERGNQTLSDFNVRICRENDRGFISESELREIIESTDSLFTKSIKNTNTKHLEQLIKKNPYVDDADVFVNINNELMVNVNEKRVVLRVFNQNGEGYYIDVKGGILPLSTQFTPHLLIANGYIDAAHIESYENINDSIYDGSVLHDLFSLTEIINRNSFIKAQIGQIYVNSKGEYDLIPQLGNQLIQLGSLEEAEKKLGKLEVFYKKAISKAGWEKYKTINLKYKNQVVCTRK